MIVRDGRSIGEALSVVAAAEAPFVNVPCHINMRDGNIVLTNNDHTLLGLRASTCLMPYLPERSRLLPLMQSVWYIGAGLDILPAGALPPNPRLTRSSICRASSASAWGFTPGVGM